MSVLLEVFCCYAREDRKMLEHLKTHLAPLERQGQITVWSDINLSAGEEWERELHQRMESANIILLLISPDFMASDYCYSTEMKRAIERHDQGSAHVIPILLRPTHWQNAPFAKLQIVPTDATPVTKWPDPDEAFYDIIGYINRYISGQQNQQIVSDKQQENRLQAYLDRMSDLFLKEGLRNSDHDADVRSIAQVQTINILMQLDGRCLGRVFDFLRKLRLMERERNFTRSIIDLSYIDFTHVNWSSIDLSSVNLSYVNFQGANLNGANFRQADLHHVDFTGTQLNKADFSGANLEGAQLNRASLQGANLLGTNLTYAILNGANLSEAKLSFAYLDYAELQDANLTLSNLRGASLFNANLSKAHLNSAWLCGANLVGAILDEVDCSEACISQLLLTSPQRARGSDTDFNLARSLGSKNDDVRVTDLSGARLNKANLYKVKLIRAKLNNTSFYRANLREADLRQSDLSDAILCKADLYGANLQGCKLAGCYIAGAQLEANLLTPEQQTQVITSFYPDLSYLDDYD